MRLQFLALSAAVLALSVTASRAAEPAKAAPQDPPRVVRLGAMCGGPNAVTVFREIRHYLARNGLKTEFALYSTYDDLVKALHEGDVDIAWNTPMAHGRFHMLAGDSQALVMRDTDVGYRVKLIVRKDAGISSPADLPGKTMIFGSCDAADATVLPVHFLRKEGVDFDRVKVVNLHGEVDARGYPAHSPQHVWKALVEGRGQAGILSQDRWAALQKTRPEEAARFQEVWTSPPFSHCVWTARKDFDREAGARFTKLMTAMDRNDPLTKEVLELEHCTKWVPGSQEGYGVLFDALRQKQPLPGASRK
jgi:ABC-type phosphate/phosphonate transport system substrate-binding protein